MTQAEIARTLNDEGVRSLRGARWSAPTISLTIRKHAPPDREPPMSLYSKRRSAQARARTADVMADVLAWWEQGSSLLSIIKRLNAAGRLNPHGRPWESSFMSRAIRNHLDPDALATFERQVAERRKAQGKALAAARPEDAPGYWIRTTKAAVLENVHGKTSRYTAYLDTQADRYEYRKVPGRYAIDVHFLDPAEHEKYRPVLDTTTKAPR